MEKIKNFWINSYKSDTIAFSFELVSFVFTVIAGLTLALTARDPNMLIVYPFFFVGSVTQCYACLLYTSPSPRDATLSRMPSSA